MRGVRGADRRVAGVRPDGALIDPGWNEGNLGAGQRIAILRHAIFAVEPEQPPDDQASLAVPRNDDRTGFPAFHQAGARVEAQVRLGLLRTVTFVADVLKDRLDVAIEVHRRRRTQRGFLRLKRAPRDWKYSKSRDREHGGTALEHLRVSGGRMTRIPWRVRAVTAASCAGPLPQTCPRSCRATPGARDP